MVERMGLVDFWGVAAPKRSYWEYWDEGSQFGHTFKCDDGMYVIIEIVFVSVGNSQKRKEDAKKNPKSSAIWPERTSTHTCKFNF